MEKETGFTWKLGMFVLVGLILFVLTIYLIGKQQNLFVSTFRLKSVFANVSGLKVGNNVRFSGINVGTVNQIELITDTTVQVDLVVRKEVQQFIKLNASASIGSDGLMGDKVLTIYPGSNTAATVKDNGWISSRKSIEMEDIMVSVKSSVDNAKVISTELAAFSRKMNNGKGTLSKLISDEEYSGSLKSILDNLQNSSSQFALFTAKMNNGKGALSKLVSDEKIGRTIDSTMANLQSGTKGLSETMEAAKHNFLLKGYFKKKERAAKKIQEEKDKKSKLNIKEENKADSAK